MRRLTSQDVCEACDGALIAGEHGALGPISTDTRTLEPGSTFFALKGPSFDGHHFANKAVEAGATTVVVDAGGAWPASIEGSGATILAVADTFKALEALAALHRSRFEGTVIALTGSSGKTTTKDMLAAALSTLGPVHKTPGNWNNQLGVPLTLLGLGEHRFAVVELGTNAPGEIPALAALAKPDVAVITGIGLAHTEGLGSLEGIAYEKASLFHALPPGALAVAPAMLPFEREIFEGMAGRLRRLGDASDPVQLEGLPTLALEGASAWLRVDGARHALKLQLSGAHQITNARLALNVALELGVALPAALEALAGLAPPSLRGEIRRLSDGAPMVLDCYNANPQSMAAAIRGFVAAAPEGLLLLGEMREMGDLHRAAHRDLGRLIAAEAPGVTLVAVGEGGGIIVEAAKGTDARLAPDVETAAQLVSRVRRPGQPILLKASRGVRLERAAQALQEMDKEAL